MRCAHTWLVVCQARRARVFVRLALRLRTIEATGHARRRATEINSLSAPGSLINGKLASVALIANGQKPSSRWGDRRG